MIFNNKSQISELYLFGNEMGEGEGEFQKLLQEVPEAEENVPLDIVMTLAFAMGTHTRCVPPTASPPAASGFPRRLARSAWLHSGTVRVAHSQDRQPAKASPRRVV